MKTEDIKVGGIYWISLKDDEDDDAYSFGPCIVQRLSEHQIHGDGAFVEFLPGHLWCGVLITENRGGITWFPLSSFVALLGRTDDPRGVKDENDICFIVNEAITERLIRSEEIV
ncbi:MAG: hypothetical protein UT24_C0033G0011 [Candidatus Woesebacteria bacterium GW2011_GWB1_39_12]|uniref:Uncharacterized protein n=1 Tax=Candidatus Woesebacteria bacterium GW2011_GWB1_39_12 TaxID=1618574 RepID=A0A0G0QAY7_9BACT|nr:MAG: hypothetical protein UT24_C0033G0011 [Candidatus Woesebacteria bacterium GW2011_GWB1_39_12]